MGALWAPESLLKDAQAFGILALCAGIPRGFTEYLQQVVEGVWLIRKKLEELPSHGGLLGPMVLARALHHCVALVGGQLTGGQVAKRSTLAPSGAALIELMQDMGELGCHEPTLPTTYCFGGVAVRGARPHAAAVC